MTAAGFVILLLISTAVLALVLALIVGARRGPAISPFVGLMVAVAIWAIGYSLELRSETIEAALFWLRIEYLGIPFVAVFWFLLTQELTEISARRRVWTQFSLVPAALFAAAAQFSPFREQFHRMPELELSGPLPILHFYRGPLYFANAAYSWLMIALSYLRLAWATRRRGPIVGRQALILALAGALPVAVNAGYLAGVRPWEALDLTPTAFIAGSLVIVWGIFRKSLFSLALSVRTHVFDRLPDGILLANERGELLDCNAAAERMLGPLALGRPIEDSPGIWPSLRLTMRHLMTQASNAAPAMVTSPTSEAAVSLFDDGRGAMRGVVVLVRDIRERKRAESELLHREELLSVLSEVARLLLPARGLPDYAEIARLIGEATKSDRVAVLLNELREDGALCAAPAAEWRAPSAGGSARPPVKRFAYDEVGLAQWRRRLADGEVIHGHAAEFAREERAFLDEMGARVVFVTPLFTDEGFTGMLELDKSEDTALWSGVEQEFLRSASLYLSLALRRQRTEEALRQSQKFDTMGRLAGGIAHDFNNLLQVINGYAEMALVGLPPNDPRAADLQEVVKAGQRAAGLTQQLLAFSRRTAVSSEPHDLHVTLTDMRALLKRLIGERNTLEIRCEATDSIVEIAVAHIQQIVLNLVVNARDAMPDGGTITVYTRNIDLDALQARARGLSEGRYLALHVDDTGVGMSAEIQSHLFEPFFTTKPRGRGTGLGLATVYGLVRQHHGQISVQSEVGRGTQFTILLPISRKPVVSAGAAAPTGRAAGGTLLVVEDEESVRRLWVQVLRGAGYTVLEAESGEQALDLAHAHGGTIDALISDVVMPGMSGHQIAAILCAERPGLKVLLISGYPDTEPDEGEPDAARIPVLAKPVSSETLLERVRELLAAPAPNP